MLLFLLLNPILLSKLLLFIPAELNWLKLIIIFVVNEDGFDFVLLSFLLERFAINNLLFILLDN